MRIRLLADADLNHGVGKGILRREPRIDFRTATAGELRRLSDPEVLALAASEGRILVSHDRKTMPRAFAEFIQALTSPGVFIISQKVDHLEPIEAILLVWAPSDADEWTNRICTLPL